MAGLSRFQRRLAGEVVPLAAAYNERRRRHAEALRAGIDRIEGVEIPRPIAGATPVYLRFPILARDTAHRASILARLRQAGIAASASYPTAVGDIPGIARHLAADQAPCPAAAAVASRIVTLPTHPGVTDGDVERMVGVVRSAA
jgi:dTDP-4-amino-4,6-dideoxygalactose transaminase